MQKIFKNWNTQIILHLLNFSHVHRLSPTISIEPTLDDISAATMEKKKGL